MSLLTQDESRVSSYRVLFVEPDQVSKPLKAAFEAMVSSGMEPQWVPESSLSPKTADTLYVCDPFEGPGFSALEARKCRVVGPLCVLRCLQDRRSLPHKSHPVFSVAMRGLIVTCTNLTPKERNAVRKQVELMGGHYVKDLVRTVTHLVVGSVGSTKYRVAATNGTPILALSWVEECWEEAQHNLCSATELLEKHLCPPFLGLRISVSQLHTEERRRVQKLIETNGGFYSGVLRAQETTHLVLREPQGEKYRFAQQWKLPCVLPEWVFDSIDKKFCQDESLYVISETPSGLTSTPKNEKQSSHLPNPECSNINGSFTSHLSETIQSEVSIVPAGGPVLSGSSIFLSGFGNKERCQLAKLVAACGGQVVRDHAANVVVHNEGQACGVPATTTVVNKQWLLDCHKQAKLLPTSDYLLKVQQSNMEQRDHADGTTVCLELDENKTELDRPPNLTGCSGQEAEAPTRSSPAPTQSSNKSWVVGTKSSAGSSEGVPLDSDPDQKKGENEQKLFSGMTFQIHSEFSNEDQAHVASLVTSLGGTVGEKASDILVVLPLAAVKDCNQVQVTPVWLQKCHVHNTVLSLKANPLFQPINVSSARPLDGLVISFSQYIGEEKSALANVATTLGALTQEFLVRRANLAKDLLANTHLVLPQPEGSKYQGASKWGLPAVTKHWLLACAQSGTKAPEMDYLTAQCPDTTDLSNGLQELLNMIHLCRNKENINPNVKSVTSTSTENFDIPPALLNVPFDFEDQETTADIAPAFLAIGTTDINDSSPPANTTTNAPHDDDDDDEEVTFVNIVKPQTPVTPHTSLQTSTKQTPSSEVNNKTNISKNSSVTTNQSLRNPNDDIDDDVIFVKEFNTSFKSNSKEGLISSRAFQTPKLPNFNKKWSEVKDRSELSLNQENTPSKFLNPDVKFLPEFDVEGILAEFDSPDNFAAAKAKKQSLPLEEVFSHNIEKALNNFGQSQSQPKEKLDSTPPILLKGVVAYVGKKLGPLQRPLQKLITSLGGEAKWSYDKFCTHYIYKGKSLDKEARQAKSNGAKLVSPEWLHSCSEEGKWLDENLYPPIFNPRLSLSQDISTISKPPPKTPNFYKLAKNDKDSEMLSSTAPPLSSSFSKLSSLHLPQVPFQGRLSTSMDEEARKEEEPSNAQHTSNVPQPDAMYTSAAISDFTKNVEEAAEAEFAHPKSDSSPSNPKFLEMKGGSAPSQNLPIGWLDYMEQVERTNVTDDNAESKSLPQLRRKFMFSGFSDSEKGRYQEIVSRLGGKSSECKDVDPTATHLVLAQPVKNEKFLASVSAGLWIVHTSYLDDSVKAEHFLSEEDYEWGGTQNAKLSASLPDKMANLTLCPSRWRVKCQKLGRPAFHSWQVVIYNNAPIKALAFKRILQMGGAIVLSPEDALQATHAFINVEETIPPISDLFRAGVKCLKPEYLAFYLTDDVIQDENEFLVPEALKLLKPPKNKAKRTTQADTQARTRASKRAKRS